MQLFQPLHYPDLCLPDDYEGGSQHFWICAPVCVTPPSSDRMILNKAVVVIEWLAAKHVM